MTLWFRFHDFCESEICPVLLWDVGSLVWDAADSGAVLLIAPGTNPPHTVSLPQGSCCFVQAALLLCINRCISAQQASRAGAVNRTDNRFQGGGGSMLWTGSEPCTLEAAQLCPGAQHPWNKHLPDSLGSFYLTWGGQACRSHCLWIWIHFTFYLRKQGR